MPGRLRVAALQLSPCANRFESLTRAAALIKKAAAQGAQLVALPECFTAKYSASLLQRHAEWVPHDALQGRLQMGRGWGAAMMADAAKRHAIFITGGVIERERDVAPGRPTPLFCSAPIYGDRGALVDTYRKVHLDAESDGLKPGEQGVRFNVGSLRVGMLSGSELVHAELTRTDWLSRYAPSGELPVDALCVPSAFGSEEGEQWEPLLRRTALECQSYVLAPNIAHDSADAPPHMHGHTMVINPKGLVLARCEAGGDGLAIADVEL